MPTSSMPLLSTSSTQHRTTCGTSTPSCLTENWKNPTQMFHLVSDSTLATLLLKSTFPQVTSLYKTSCTNKHTKGNKTRPNWTFIFKTAPWNQTGSVKTITGTYWATISMGTRKTGGGCVVDVGGLSGWGQYFRDRVTSSWPVCRVCLLHRSFRVWESN